MIGCKLDEEMKKNQTKSLSKVNETGKKFLENILYCKVRRITVYIASIQPFAVVIAPAFYLSRCGFDSQWEYSQCCEYSDFLPQGILRVGWGEPLTGIVS